MFSIKRSKHSNCHLIMYLVNKFLQLIFSFLDSFMYLQFIFGFGIPVTLLDQSMTMGLVMKFVYTLPTNATVFTHPYAATNKRSTQKSMRWDMYSMLEATVNRWVYALNLRGRSGTKVQTFILLNNNCQRVWHIQSIRSSHGSEVVYDFFLANVLLSCR
jgi:hypothetical protein